MSGTRIFLQTLLKPVEEEAGLVNKRRASIDLRVVDLNTNLITPRKSCFKIHRLKSIKIG